MKEASTKSNKQYYNPMYPLKLFMISNGGSIYESYNGMTCGYNNTTNITQTNYISNL